MFVQVQDSIPFSIGLSSDESSICAGSNGVLFPKGQPIPSVKILTFQCSNFLHLETFYVNANELPPGTSPKISIFTIGPFRGSHDSKKKVEVRVQLNLHGIVCIESAALIEDHVDDSVTTGGDNYSNVGAMDVEPNSETVVNDIEDGVNKKCESPYTSADGTRKDKANRSIHVQVSENIYGGMTNDEILEAQEKELNLTHQDRTMELTKDKKNSLESYVYEMRSKLFNTYRNFASEQERDGLSRCLQETEEWLYDDGDDETLHAYSAKLEDLKQLVDPIENRYKDEEARAQATRDLLSCIVEHRMSAGSLALQNKEQIINECNKAEQWLREKMQQQDSLPKSSDPVFWSSDIKSKAEELNVVCQQILGSKGSPIPVDVQNTSESDHQGRQ